MKLTIIGASGHGKVVADIAKLDGYESIEFLDDDPSVTSCAGYPVAGRTEEVAGIDNDVFVAIGNTGIRQRFTERYHGKEMPVLAHPSAVIAKNIRIGAGTVIMAGAVINPCAVIGKGVILNTCSSVDHDCKVHDYVHIAVGAHLCGNVEIGARTWIGAGSTILNNVKICSDCIIGAGAVVIKDIEKPGTYIGIPARIYTHSKTE